MGLRATVAVTLRPTASGAAIAFAELPVPVASSWIGDGLANAFYLVYRIAVEIVRCGEGFRIARHGDGEPSLALSELDPEGPLEAALLFKRTGTLVAGWTRTNARQDVLSVMAATLFASAATIVEALGDSNPASAAVETDLRRMLAVKTGSQHALLLVASKAVSEGVLRQLAKKMIRDAPAQRTSHDPRTSVMVKP